MDCVMPATHLLIVDDEIHELDRLRKALSPLGSSWEISFAKNAFEALAQFECTPFDVIVTDLSMPGMDGIQLLTEVVRRFPRTIRILMTNPQERERIFHSICLAHQFLIKPCKTAELVNAIQRTFRLHHRLNTPNIQQMVVRIGVLPSIPAVYYRLIKIINDQDSSMSKAAALIEQDTGMSAKVLQLVNSAFFGLRQQVTSIAQAVPLLGLDTMKSLVAWFQLATQFSNVTQAGILQDKMQQHCMLTARYAQVLANHLGFDRYDIDDIFTSGLLHEVGVLILANAFPREYLKISSGPYDQKYSLTRSEINTFGVTHAEVGAYLLALWGFREQAVEAVCFHHQPWETASELNSISVLYLAHVLACQQDPATPLQFNEKYLQELHVLNHLDEFRALCQRVKRSDG